MYSTISQTGGTKLQKVTLNTKIGTLSVNFTAKQQDTNAMSKNSRDTPFLMRHKTGKSSWDSVSASAENLALSASLGCVTRLQLSVVTPLFCRISSTLQIELECVEGITKSPFLKFSIGPPQSG